MRIHSHEDLGPSTVIGILIGLLAIGTATWIVVRTASDYQQSAHPDQSAAAFVDRLELDPSVAENGPGESDSGRFPADDIDPAVFDDRDDDGMTPTTQPPSTTPEPTTPPKQPQPPKTTPDTTPPPPPNEPPAIDGLAVHSEGGRLTVQARALDSEGEIESIQMIVSEGSQLIGIQAIEPEPNASTQPVKAEFTIDTTNKARRLIRVTVEVVDRAGATAAETADREVVRRTKVWVSPISMTLRSSCFNHSPALALTGGLTTAGTGIDNTTALSGEFRADKFSMILADEQTGFVDGDKLWFLLVTANPDLVDVNSRITNLGKIQTLHKQVGSFTQTFNENGCSGAIAYTITAELLQ